MANNNPKTSHLTRTQWKPGQSGNPKGKPKGSKHVSTYIREMMQDEYFEYKLNDGTIQKCTPIRAIVNVLITKAVTGDLRAFDLIAKYGYGTKLDIETNILPQPILGGQSSTQKSNL